MNKTQKTGDVPYGYEDDCVMEGRHADVSIPLFGLNMLGVRIAASVLCQRTVANSIQWVLKVASDASSTASELNCGVAVWTILQAGGINLYNPKLSGPTDPVLRNKYKCDEGSLLWGMFDNFSWRKSIASPVLVLHLVASARQTERSLPLFNPFTLPLEEIITKMYAPYDNPSDRIIPLDELAPDETKKPSSSDIVQMLAPFAFLGDQLKRAGFQTAWSSTSGEAAQAHKASYSNVHVEKYAQDFQNGIHTFYNQRFTKNVAGVINVFKRVMR